MSLAAYDLIFATHLDTELIERVILGRPGATMAVDIDNVESSAISHELEATGASMSMLRRFAKRMDRDRWRRIELDSLDTNDVTFVCRLAMSIRMLFSVPIGASARTNTSSTAATPVLWITISGEAGFVSAMASGGAGD